MAGNTWADGPEELEWRSGRNPADRAVAGGLAAQSADARAGAGIGEVLRLPAACRTVSIDGDGQFQTCLERVRKYLRESKSKRTLVGAANDPSALGALRAFEEAGRARSAPSWTEWRTGGPRRTAHAEHAADRVSGLFPGEVRRRSAAPGAGHPGPEAVPPAMFTTHQIITPENVDHFYPTTVCWRRRGRAGHARPLLR